MKTTVIFVCPNCKRVNLWGPEEGEIASEFYEPTTKSQCEKCDTISEFVFYERISVVGDVLLVGVDNKINSK